MKQLLKTALAMAGVLSLSACAGMGLQKAEMMAPGGSSFEKALYMGYVELSKMEFDEGDYQDSDVFASRAMSVAGGTMVGPEEVSARKIPADKVGVLTSARGRLTAALDAGGADKAPEHAARAQVMFDCWMQEQEENFQPKDIEACRAGFFDALGKLEAALEPKMAEKPKMMPKKEMPKQEMMKPKIDGIYILFFDFDSAKLSHDAMQVLAKAVKDYGVETPENIVITAHTDTSGAKGYNQQLSERRAKSVVDALVKAGIPAKKLEVTAYGQRRPLVSGDGKKEPKNRRVEVIFE